MRGIGLGPGSSLWSDVFHRPPARGRGEGQMQVLSPVSRQHLGCAAGAVTAVKGSVLSHPAQGASVQQVGEGSAQEREEAASVQDGELAPCLGSDSAVCVSADRLAFGMEGMRDRFSASVREACSSVRVSVFSAAALQNSLSRCLSVNALKDRIWELRKAVKEGLAMHRAAVLRSWRGQAISKLVQLGLCPGSRNGKRLRMTRADRPSVQRRR